METNPRTNLIRCKSAELPHWSYLGHIWAYLELSGVLGISWTIQGYLGLCMSFFLAWLIFRYLGYLEYLGAGFRNPCRYLLTGALGAGLGLSEVWCYLGLAGVTGIYLGLSGVI